MAKKSREKNIGAGIIYFYLHFVIEVCCFFYIGRLEGNGLKLWAVFLFYNFLAFFPQAVIGYFSDCHLKIPICAIGLGITAVVLAVFPYVPVFVSLIPICLANGLIHVNGAEVTLRSSGGNLFSSGLFVAGGSFGVVCGRLLAPTPISSIYIILLAVSAIPLSLYAQTYLNRANEEFEVPCADFKYAKVRKSAFVTIALVVFIVFVRGYMGYGIPTSWNKSTFQTVFLYFTMGIGKALGGLIADFIGVKKTAVLSSVIAVPLLLFGDEHMYISLLGVMFFSMTMSVTLALLVSILPKNPGLAFGLTTIGLFLGTAPTFFFKLGNIFSNCLVILVLTVVCVVIFSYVIRKDEKNV